MKNISSTQFRKNTSSYLNDVEDGEIILISRHGKVIAKIVSSSEDEESPAWKKDGLQLATNGARLSTAIIDER